MDRFRMPAHRHWTIGATGAAPAAEEQKGVRRDRLPVGGLQGLQPPQPADVLFRKTQLSRNAQRYSIVNLTPLSMMPAAMA